jgi:hypothetical protein
MHRITNDKAFREAIDALDPRQARLLAGRLAETVLPLSSDRRLNSIARVASDPDATAEDLRNAWKAGKAISIELSARCGAEGEWSDQADYFVARAATAAVTPAEASKPGGPAWQAAMNARMAQTCEQLDASDTQIGEVRERQYRILAEFLNQEGTSHHE